MDHGMRIESLAHLTPGQDLEVVARHMATDTLVQAIAPERRADWYETHMKHAKRFGTTVAEQIVISRQMADGMDDTDHAGQVQAQMEKIASDLDGS